MTKLMKQYNKILLIGLGILLMVGFLIGDSLRFLEQSLNIGAGISVGGERIDGYKVAISNARYELVRQRVPELTAIVPAESLGSGERDSRAEHWLLLAHEARRAGLIGPEQDGAAFLTDEYPDLMVQSRVAQFERQGGRADQTEVDKMRESFRDPSLLLPGVRAQAPMAEAKLSDAAAEYKGVSRLQATYGSLPRLSSDRLYEQMAHILNRATWEYVWVGVDEAAAAQLPAPENDSELLVFFNRYRDTDAAQSDIGVGYRLPPRVKLQWLALDAGAIRSQIKIRALDIERRIRERAAAPGEDEAVRRALAEKQLADELFEKILSDAELVVKGELLKVLANVRDERTGGLSFKKLPDDWSILRPDLGAIGKIAADRVNAKYSINLAPFKAAFAEDAWQTAAELRRLPGVGNASLKRDTRSLPLSDVAMSLREFGPFDPQRAPTFPAQVNVPFVEPLLGLDGSAYYVMFTAARGASGPESMSEIRDKVLADYRRVKAYEALAAQIDTLTAKATLEGLDALAASVEVNGKPATLVTEIYSERAMENSVQPGDKNMPWMARVPDLSDQILSRAEKLDATKPMDEQDITARVFSIAVPAQRGIAVIRLTGYQPLTREEFEKQVAYAASRPGSSITKSLAQRAMSLGVDSISAVRPGEQPPAAHNPFTHRQLVDRLRVSDANPSKPAP